MERLVLNLRQVLFQSPSIPVLIPPTPDTHAIAASLALLSLHGHPPTHPGRHSIVHVQQPYPVFPKRPPSPPSVSPHLEYKATTLVGRKLFRSWLGAAASLIAIAQWQITVPAKTDGDGVDWKPVEAGVVVAEAGRGGRDRGDLLTRILGEKEARETLFGGLCCVVLGQGGVGGWREGGRAEREGSSRLPGYGYLVAKVFVFVPTWPKKGRGNTGRILSR